MDRLIAEICHFISFSKKLGGMYQTPLPGLNLLHDPKPTKLEPMVYDPVVCLVLQGAKETRAADQTFKFRAGDSLIVSHAMPVIAAVTEATRERPYVAMILSIDLEVARSVHEEIGAVSSGHSDAASLQVALSDAKFIDTMARLFRASLDPAEARTVAPLCVREAHFRLLRAGHGGMLRQMMTRDSIASRLGRAVARLRSDYKRTIPSAELAAIAGMSLSSFYDHFKSLTGRSPLQFQKDLRLTEARRLLIAEGRSVSATAFAVGYESPTQFSREYARKFGRPPRAELTKRSAA